MGGTGMMVRWVLGGMVVLAVALGGLLYWAQVYAGYEVTEGGEMTRVIFKLAILSTKVSWWNSSPCLGFHLKFLHD